MPPNNSGQFMAGAGGGGDALQEAMQRRGFSGGALNQNTQDPNSAPPSNVPPGAPQAMPQGGGQMPQPAPGGAAMPDAGMPPGNPEAQLILKAMTSYLKSIADINEGHAGVNQPTLGGQ